MPDEPNELAALPSNWTEMTARQKAEWLYHQVFCATPEAGRGAWLKLVAKLLEGAAPTADKNKSRPA